MFGTETQVDANFYRFAHQLASTSTARKTEPHVKRCPPRVKHRPPRFATHRIAPIYNGDLPDESAFVNVRCYGISRSGLAFLLPSSPDFRSLVVALATLGNELFVTADVWRSGGVLVHPSGFIEGAKTPQNHFGHRNLHRESAKAMVLVGCRFTKRIEKLTALDETNPLSISLHARQPAVERQNASGLLSATTPENDAYFDNVT